MKHKIEIIGKILYHNPKKTEKAPNSITVECELGGQYPTKLKIDFWNGTSIDDFNVGDLVVVLLNNLYLSKRQNKDKQEIPAIITNGEYIEKVAVLEQKYQTKKTPETAEIIDDEIPF